MEQLEIILLTLSITTILILVAISFSIGRIIKIVNNLTDIIYQLDKYYIRYISYFIDNSININGRLGTIYEKFDNIENLENDKNEILKQNLTKINEKLPILYSNVSNIHDKVNQIVNVTNDNKEDTAKISYTIEQIYNKVNTTKNAKK